MNNIDQEIRNSIKEICKNKGYPDSSEMIINLVEKFSSEEIDSTEVDLLIQNLLEGLD